MSDTLTLKNGELIQQMTTIYVDYTHLEDITESLTNNSAKNVLKKPKIYKFNWKI